MSEFQEIKSNLMLLTNAELREIQKICSALLLRSTDIDSEGATLYDHIQTCLTTKSVSCPSVYCFKKQKSESFNSLCDVAKNLNEWMTKCKVVKKVDRHILLAIITGLVFENIERTNIPITAATMVSFFKNAIPYFDNAFPGYSRNGLVNIIINTRKIKSEKDFSN